jgi:hypothetical protein
MSTTPADEPLAHLLIRAPSGEELSLELVSTHAPDLGTIEALAWLQLALERTSGELSLERLRGDLAELVELSGLGGKMRRKPEAGKEAARVEE